MVGWNLPRRARGLRHVGGDKDEVKSRPALGFAVIRDGWIGAANGFVAVRMGLGADPGVLALPLDAVARAFAKAKTRLAVYTADAQDAHKATLAPDGEDVILPVKTAELPAYYDINQIMRDQAGRATQASIVVDARYLKRLCDAVIDAGCGHITGDATTGNPVVMRIELGTPNDPLRVYAQAPGSPTPEPVEGVLMPIVIPSDWRWDADERKYAHQTVWATAQG